MLKYSLARLGLFVVCFLAVWAVWLRALQPDAGQLMKSHPNEVLIALVIAALGSLVLSLWMLRGMRDAASRRIEERVNHTLAERAARRHEPDPDELAEDAEAAAAPRASRPGEEEPQA